MVEFRGSRKSSCTSDSDEEIERWKNWLHEVTTLNCNMLVRSLHCMTTEVRSLPMYDGLTVVDGFLEKFEREVSEQQCFDALKWAMHATPARWRGTHQRSFEDWRRCRRMMRLPFGKLQMRLAEKYDGHDDPHTHLAKWTKVYGGEPKPKWVHLFYHTLDVILMIWYTETELHHGMSEWDILRDGFLLTFTFEDCWWDTIDNVLQAVKAAIFKISQDPMELL